MTSNKHRKIREINWDDVDQRVRENRNRFLGMNIPPPDFGVKVQRQKRIEWETHCNFCGIGITYIGGSEPNLSVTKCYLCKNKSPEDPGQ